MARRGCKCWFRIILAHHRGSPARLLSLNLAEDRYFESARLGLHDVVLGHESKPPLVLHHVGRDHARYWDFVANVGRSRCTPAGSVTAQTLAGRTRIV
jgi:hypothetical protein